VSEKSLRNGDILVLLSPQRPYWARSGLSPWNECEKDRQQRQPVVYWFAAERQNGNSGLV
jgi:hypothetical protein